MRRHICPCDTESKSFRLHAVTAAATICLQGAALCMAREKVGCDTLQRDRLCRAASPWHDIVLCSSPLAALLHRHQPPLPCRLTKPLRRAAGGTGSCIDAPGCHDCAHVAHRLCLPADRARHRTAPCIRARRCNRVAPQCDQRPPYYTMSLRWMQRGLTCLRIAV